MTVGAFTVNAAGVSFQAFDPFSAPLSGSTLIEAGAGTGKTHAIARLYVRLLLERQLRVNEILVVTFTEAAAKDLRERIHDAVAGALRGLSGGDAGRENAAFGFTLRNIDADRARTLLTLALRSFDDAAVYTIHGFCRRVLLEHAFECGSLFSTELVSDQDELLDETARDFWRRNLYNASPLFIAYCAREGFGDPSAFRQLYEIRTGVQSHRVIPADQPDPDASVIEEETMRRFGDLADAWRTARDEVAALLFSPSLKQNVYSPAIARKMTAGMDEFTGRKFVDGGYHDMLNKWTPAALSRGAKKGGLPPSHPFFDACGRLHDCITALCETFERKLCFLKILFLSRATDELEKEKRRRNVLSFDDMLLHVHRALADAATGPYLKRALGAVYKAALIDEFQDTDPVQYDIFSALFGESSPLFLIGDPKQAIYRFRGADIFAYFKAARNATNRFTLLTNYRSDKLLLRAINALFGAHANPFAAGSIEYREVGAGLTHDEYAVFVDGERRKPFTLWLHERSDPSDVGALPGGQSFDAVSRAVCAEIGGLLADAAIGRARIGGRNIRPSDIAVLVRTNNEATGLNRMFSSLTIPSVIQVADSVFAGHEAFELELLLTGLADPKRPELLKAALGTIFFDLSAGSIDTLASDEREWNRWQLRALFYREIWRRDGVLVMLRVLMNDEGLRARLCARNGGERTLTNIVHCAELLQREYAHSRRGMTALSAWLANKRNNAGRSTAPDEEMVRLESDEESVRIVTIHKSKGLQYPIVFCPFAWRSPELRADSRDKRPFLFHDPDHDNASTLALDSDAIARYRPLALEETLAENMRLLYVALTRAQACCYCVWSPANRSETSGLAWLLFGSGCGKPYHESLRAKMMSLTDRAAREELAAKFGDGGDCIEIARMPDAPPLPLAPRERTGGTVSARVFSGAIPPPRRVLSYTSIAHPHAGSGADLSGRDVAITSRRIVEKSGGDAAADDERTILSFPRGAVAGTMLHEVFEQLDFQETSSSAADARIRGALSKYGFDESWFPPVARTTLDVTRAELDPESGLRLAAVPAANCLKEMEFYVPLRPFSTSRLFELAGEEAPVAAECSLPDFTNVHGHLKGYIDLVFAWKDRWFIIDWKSNHLGEQRSDYSAEAMAKAMRDDHYLLQYHLYVAALHRYLSVRNKGYAYERNFGGVYYIFLRGVGGDDGARDGIFFDRPQQERIERLCGLFIAPPAAEMARGL